MNTTLQARPASLADEHVRLFCNELVPGGVPITFNPVVAPQTSVNDCVSLVNRAVENDGGERIDGWALWECPRVLIEAEYHCVWRTPEGKLQDLSPLPPGITHRLFILDPNLVYEEKQINNVRRSLGSHPSVQKLIDAYDAYFEVLNRGERACQYGEISIPPDELDPVIEGILNAGRDVTSWLASSGSKIGRNERCSCGSGLKYKRCHGN